MLVGFHGYAEDAGVQLERMRGAGTDWLLLSVQALHVFYRGRSSDVVASWMTRQNREAAIADNLAYVSSVVASAVREFGVTRPIIFAGFSQGVAMAFRAACSSPVAVGGVIALGGDVPPELDASALGRIPAALMGRGARDEWYTAPALEADVRRLHAAGCAARPFEFDGGHEWTDAFSETAAAYLKDCR